MKSNDRALALALLFFLLSVYLLTYSGALHSSDGQAMFSVAESVVRRADYDINQIRWMGLQQGDFGLDGDLYCHKGLPTSLLTIPLIWVGIVVPFWGVVQTGMLFNVIVTAVTGVLVFLYVRRLGYSPRTALISGLVFGLGTMAWPYAKYFFSEPLTGLSLVACAYFLLHLASGEGIRSGLKPALLSGFFLGLAVAARFANAVMVPLFGGALVAYLLRAEGMTEWSKMRANSLRLLSRRWPELGAFVLPLVLWVLVIAAYNHLRFGSPFTTGYLSLEESFSTPWTTGILGLLISPGRSIFIYCPVLLALIPAWPPFFRRHRLEAIFLALISLSYLLVYGKWFMWHGGFAWGPRFLVPTLPLLIIMLAPLVERLKGKSWKAFWALCGLSVAVQVLGLSVHFIRHQEALLETGLPLFDPITFFDPRYSQLGGTLLTFLRPENLDFAWIQGSPSLRVDWLGLATSVVLVILSGTGMVVSLRQPRTSRPRRLYVFVLLPLLLAGGTAVSLARYKDDGHGDYVRMLQFLEANSQQGDAIIQNSPPETAVLQNHYKGHLPSYGLFEGEQPLSDDTQDLLDRLAKAHPRFWVIPDSLPPHLSSLDRWFTERGYSAMQHSYGTERLTLYTRS
ncbi:MAG: hypothetical protein CEE40_03800 [Chloroflexi bacterium B3_Chlor]|nr:MAG: hypothetical protein CEE40_03800 [Chloroflexi bacterium B3_Chlor]